MIDGPARRPAGHIVAGVGVHQGDVTHGGLRLQQLVDGRVAGFGVAVPAVEDVQFRVAGDRGGDVAGVVWGSDNSYGDCVRIISSYDYDTGDVEMWVNPDCALGELGNPSVTVAGVYPGNAYVAYAFRQSYGNTTQTIDNLIVGTSWDEVCCECIPEPASLAMLVLSGLLFVARRR